MDNETELPKSLKNKLDVLADEKVLGEELEAPAYVPVYRMMAENKIAVSKKTGNLWKSRKSAAWAKLRNTGELDRWEEALRYYRNDHSADSRRNRLDDGSSEQSVRLTTRGLETENIVFANVTALVPAVYAKNPTAEFSMDDDTYDEFGKTAEKLVNALMRMKSAPGVNIKPKARRGVINCTLTNEAWFEVGYNTKEQSSDAAFAELEKIGEKLAAAKDTKEIKELEGQLMALETKVDLLAPSGPFLRVRSGHEVLVDPDATMTGEEKFIFIADYIETELLKAVYGQGQEESDEYKSLFEPTHILRLDAETESDQTIDNSFSFLTADVNKSYQEFGYADEDSYQRAQRTKVWYAWDKTTRRVYLFNDKDWKWPLWVWDDPYQYDDFYPVIRMNFYDDPTEYYARSETMMYLDQQDAINAINNEVAKTRAYITGKVIYNENVIKDSKVVDAFIEGTSSRKAMGINAPPETDLTKLFAPFLPQSAAMLNTVVFDKSRLLEAIDRVSSVTSVMRGVEYKTNTTNKAIESYESTNQSRLDEKIDAVEDAIGAIAAKLLHLCLRFMDTETVASILGEKDAAVWDEHKTAFLEGGVKFNATIVGGSTLKPTSSTKKQQAIQLSQALGQFASAAPVAILVALKVMERAFDEVVIRDEDWKMIMDSIQQQLQRGQPTAGEGGQPAEGGEQGINIEAVEKLIDSFPEEAKLFLADMIAKGTPIRQAVEQVVTELQNEQGGEQ